MMMHTAALCCVGPFSVGVAKYVVLFSFLFLFWHIGKPDLMIHGQTGGAGGRRHRAQYGQDGKGAFWEWWQEGLYEYPSTKEDWLWGHFSKPVSLHLATGTPLRKRDYVLLLLVLKRERQHMHCCCDCMKRRIEAHYRDEYELLGIFWNIYSEMWIQVVSKRGLFFWLVLFYL